MFKALSFGGLDGSTAPWRTATEGIARKGRTLTPEEVVSLEIFRKWREERDKAKAAGTGTNKFDAQLRTVAASHLSLAKGEVLCLEGEKGNTAFLVLKGSVELFVTPPPASSRFFLARLWDRFHSWMEGVRRIRPRAGASVITPPPNLEKVGRDDEMDEKATRKLRMDFPNSWVLLDSPRPFRYRTAADRLPAGSLFDEVTCLKSMESSNKGKDLVGRPVPGTYPRAAAARAAEPSEVLEINNGTLNLLKDCLEMQVKEIITRIRAKAPDLLPAGSSATKILKDIKDLASFGITPEDAQNLKLRAQVEEAFKNEAFLGRGTPLSEAELKTLTISGMKPFEKLRFNKLAAGSIVRRRFKPGEVICRKGEFGSTAYLIETGTVVVHSIRTSSRTAPSGPVLTDTGEHTVETYDITMGPGEFFGEQTCMNFYPRSATVEAQTECTLVEFLRNVLDQLLMKGSPFKDQLERVYKERSLSNHLQRVPLFRDLPPEALRALQAEATFERYPREGDDLDKKGPGRPPEAAAAGLPAPPVLTPDEQVRLICREGDIADSFYLVRTGTVKVTKHAPGGEFVLPYLRMGDFFGEIGLLSGGLRTATCSAVDHVDLVKIPKETFDLVLKEYPQVRASLVEVAIKRVEAEMTTRQRYAGSNLNEFVQQGLMLARDLLVIDLNKCTRCDACVHACAATHGGVSRLPRDGLRFENYLITGACRSCTDPECMIGCPVGSIRRKGNKEIIIENWCIGCNVCANNCPYGSISMHYLRTDEPGSNGSPHAVVKKQALGCDLCSGFPEPQCVHSCPHEAAMRVDPVRYFERPDDRAPGRDNSTGS
jgi:CRP-like cAMP-binding protein/Fe-S-cluster-containing hydrogenase component 2